ncbi:phage tail protein [Pseudomonas fontis]|uniref:Phage tail protein n=1 Tax=Pseudomonas fontis TaxID=2942633 RepID=A0ABT5NPN5_9PSED|nr:phage tail protein [Pseudomonas fontis]MDD0972425.1 phage tail protein [Pseudomonas fontis]MDD0990118.1 phage tail protein [Pseudomonas fontis]
MTDQTSQFFAILTAVGEAKQANANALGVPWTFAQMGVGDANGTEPTPLREQTKLINERRRAPLNQVKVDPKNPNMIIAEQVIPPDVGGWWIREIGLYDAAGDLVAVANCAPSFKPLLTQGTGKTQIVRLNIIVTSAANVQLKIDPAVVLATREYVDGSIDAAINKQDIKQSVLVATTGPINLLGVQTIDGIAVPLDARVLVKHQSAGGDNGIYLVRPEAWVRASDADTGGDITPGMLVVVEQGVLNADTLWVLTSDAPIVLGSTMLAFRNITDGFATLVSPTFSGDPKAPTPLQFDRDKSVATTEFVGDALGSYRGVDIVTAPAKVLTKANIGYLMVLSGNGSIAVTLPPASSVPAGASVSFFVDHGYFAVDSINAASTDIINVGYGAFVPSLSVSNGDFVTLVNTGVSAWFATNRSVRMDQASEFRVSRSGTSGYRYLPGGMIEQWGISAATTDVANVTFPIQFKERVANILTNDNTAAGGTVMTMFQFSGLSLTGFTAQNIGALVRGSTGVAAPVSSHCPWWALGW